MNKKYKLFTEQKKKLEILWFIYGNNGLKHSHPNHRFIQCLIEHNEDTRNFFKPDKECIEEVDKIIKGKK